MLILPKRKFYNCLMSWSIHSNFSPSTCMPKWAPLLFPIIITFVLLLMMRSPYSLLVCYTSLIWFSMWSSLSAISSMSSANRKFVIRRPYIVTLPCVLTFIFSIMILNMAMTNSGDTGSPLLTANRCFRPCTQRYYCIVNVFMFPFWFMMQINCDKPRQKTSAILCSKKLMWSQL